MRARCIDAHQHFWKLERGDYGWLTPELGPIYRDFLPGDLRPMLEMQGIDGTVLVQAAPTDAETDFLLSLAENHDFIEGVVGWVDFEAASASARLAALAAHPKFKGVRPMIQDIENIDWMLQPDLGDAFRAVIETDIVFDALVLPRHLNNLSRLLDRYPDMRVVVDHCAKPEISAGNFDQWAGAMATIAGESTAACKLSGLVTEAGAGWSAERLKPYVDHVLEIFGPGRVIWGSDWPVCTLAASYDTWIEATGAFLKGLSGAEQAAILGGNAIRIYRLEGASDE